MLSQRLWIIGENMCIFPVVAFCPRSSDRSSFRPSIDLSTAFAMNSVHSDVKLVETRSFVSIVTTALPSNLVNPHVEFVESFMDDTCHGKHEWTFDSTYKRAPGGGIHFCKQCGCLNELMQTQVQGECEYGASFNPEGRLL